MSGRANIRNGETKAAASEIAASRSGIRMERQVRYQVLGKRGIEDMGEGKTINRSSCGVLFTCQHDLQRGRRVRLWISWPVLLNDECALRLVVYGRVVRSEAGRAAIEIQ
jgi:hypothetical protein